MASGASKKTDYVVSGLTRFLKQFRDKRKLNALAASYLAEVQKLENAIWEVIEYRMLDNAEGIQLDILGKIVGRGRNDLSDADYKLAIRAQIRINRSLGRPSDLIDVAELSSPDGSDFSYSEYYPATVCIAFYTLISNTALVYDNLKKTKGAGIKLFFIYSEAEQENTFTFSSADSPEVDTSKGFGDETFTAGGVWANVLKG